MLNVKRLLASSSISKNSFIGSLDTRVKLFYSLFILVWTFIIDDWFSLLLLMVLTGLVAINVGSVSEYLSLLWSLKWLVFMVVGFNIIFLGVTDIPYYLELVFSLVILITAFSVFNQTTSPDELLDALLKLKIPPGIAWRVSLSLRQALFFIDDFANIMAIQRKRIDIQELGFIRSHIQLAAILITTMFSISILRAGELSNALRARGFTTVHQNIVFHSNQISRKDILFLLFLTITLVPLLFVSSQVFI